MFKNLFGKSSTTADSGSEVDRYGSHFDLDKNGKEEIKKALRTPGVGAEQDRYQSHFGLEHQQIERAKAALLKARDEGAEKALFGSYWGLGADGQARLKALTSMGGVGAEQDRYGSHFSVDPKTVDRTVDKVKQKVADGINNIGGVPHAVQ